jgi:hypothetical protein
MAHNIGAKMDDDEVRNINTAAAVHVQAWLARLDEDSVNSERELLSSLYAAMVVASLLGYSLQLLCSEATEASARLLELLESSDDKMQDSA